MEQPLKIKRFFIKFFNILSITLFFIFGINFSLDFLSRSDSNYLFTFFLPIIIGLCGIVYFFIKKYKLGIIIIIIICIYFFIPIKDTKERRMCIVNRTIDNVEVTKRIEVSLNPYFISDPDCHFSNTYIEQYKIKTTIFLKRINLYTEKHTIVG